MGERSAQKKRVAILGGGQAALTTALQLTDPRNPAAPDTEVTIYQLGWRLGGKGATGRPVDPGAGENGHGAIGRPARILEHGLHQWYGWYENAFRQIRDVYGELEPQTGPPWTFESAFTTSNVMYLVEWIDGDPQLWKMTAGTQAGEPGDGQTAPAPRQLLDAAIDRLIESFTGSPLERRADRHGVFDPAQALLDAAIDRAGVPGIDGTGPVRLLQLAKHIARVAEDGGEHPIVGDVQGLLKELEPIEAIEALTWRAALELVDDAALVAVAVLLMLFMSIVWRRLLESVDTVARRAWITLNFGFGCVLGAICDGVLVLGFDTINHYDFREWLRRWAFPDGGLLQDSPVIEAVYLAAFAYPGGDTQGPPPHPANENLEAGTALRGAVLTLLGYKGSICYRFTAGTADTTYAPVYEVLRRRGVEVRFFSRVTGLEIRDRQVVSVRYGRQAEIKDGARYDPLAALADGTPCWPVEPCWDQLVRGDELRELGTDFEWPTAKPGESTETLELGRDYDEVVLGISIAALAEIFGDQLDAWPELKHAIDAIQTVRTQSLQLWLNESATQLGFPVVAKQGTGWRYDTASPIYVWGDFSELIAEENWPADNLPVSLAYFTATMLDDPEFATQEAANGKAAQDASYMLAHGLRFLLPKVVDAQGEFRWSLLVDPDPQHPSPPGSEALARQWVRGNVTPTERYVLSVVDSSALRLPPRHESGPTNLYLTGDWTRCVMNVGCMEAATMSGMLCANAISGFPAREDIARVDW